MRPVHAKFALLTAAATMLLGPLTAVPAAATPVSTHDAVTAVAVRRDLPEPPPAEIVCKELGDLNVAALHSMAGYSRAKFPHWIIQHGTCDTREVVLQRDGTDVVQDDQCRAVFGTWISPYDGKVFTASGQLDVDHLVSVPAAV
ncbi:hypothetical protein ABZ770_42005 [Streptomyces sp. NPDC006654]|uniref:hypothetical protein n=1 Tax=Streptomyces sp. NPDC006654 TaxID=3156897 RepID=UPI0033F0E764